MGAGDDMVGDGWVIRGERMTAEPAPLGRIGYSLGGTGVGAAAPRQPWHESVRGAARLGGGGAADEAGRHRDNRVRERSSRWTCPMPSACVAAAANRMRSSGCSL